jgi:phosphoglycerate dehydrogenase-like enzyme
MLILMVLRKVRENQRHDDVRLEKRHEFRGKTLGILGLGSIGKEVARIANGFNVKLLYNQRKRLSEEEEKDLGIQYRSFDELLGDSDILSVHVPLTEETRGIIGKDEIAKMKDGAVIVNTSRKDVVDEEAVFSALEAGKLFGFGTDFVPDRTFSGYDVFMTPHIAGITEEAIIWAFKQLFENYSRFLRGEKPLNIVNNV